LCPFRIFTHMGTIEITSSPDLDAVISVADLKNHLRVDHSDEDALIEAYRDAAIKWVEDYCNTRLGDVTAVYHLDYFKTCTAATGDRVQHVRGAAWTSFNHVTLPRCVMIIGKSDRRIAFERATETTNDYGEKAQTWSVLVTVWAELMKTSSPKEAISDRQDTASKTLTFKVRSSSDTRAVNTKDRVVYDSKYFDITGIEEVGRNDQLVFTCRLNDTSYDS